MSNQIEIRHIRYFIAVAEELHFRKAAERLFISQPGLSRQIRQMEDHLGFQLFNRDNKHVRLTKAATHLLEEFRVMLKQLDITIEHARSLSKGAEGNLNLGYVGSAMQAVIPEMMLKFKKNYPSIRFNLKVMDNQEQIDQLISGEIDLGFVRLNRIPEDLKTYPVHQDTFSLVLPKGHPLNAKNFKNLIQLKAEPFILFSPSYSNTYYENVMKIFDDSGFIPIVSHNTVHAQTISKLVENNFGISIVPSILEDQHNKKIKYIKLSGIPQRTTLSAIWHTDNHKPVLQNLLQLFRWDTNP